VTAYEMTPVQSLSQYASVVWAPKDLIEIRTLPTKRKNGLQPVSIWTIAGDITNFTDRLSEMNNVGLNIYAGVCPRKERGSTTDDATLPGMAAWADCDRINPRDAWKHTIKAGMPQPSMAINSGHGAHLYWGLNNKAPLAELSILVGDIAALLGSDPSVKNPSRIMRLPGFMNLKDPCAPCKLLFVEPGARYDFADLRAIVPKQAKRHATCNVPSNSSEVIHHSKNTFLEHGERNALVERGRKYAATVHGSAPGGRTDTAYR